ncbi:MAG: restriction endonuclease subunit S [Deltaproteobacteria bacterium]|nr:restriction endonuclease subunit S [Deltaproteobacteria bacterium]
MKAGWKTKKLGDVCSLLNRGISPIYLEKGGVRVLNQKCIRDHQVNYESSRRHDIKAKKVPEERFILLGDVLINSTGTGTLGRVAQVREEPDEPTTVDSHVTIVRPKPGMFHLDFFGFMLATIEDGIKEAGEGCGGQTELARSVLAERFSVRFPESLPEQKRIVGILDEAFAGIATAKANAEKNLRNARALFESHLNEVFSRKGEGWVEKKISEIAKCSLGKMLDKTKNKGEPQYYLRNLNVRWFNFDLSDLLQMRFLPSEEEKYTAQKGDVLVCEGGYPGRAATWNENFPIYFQKALHRVRFYEPEHNQWFVYFLYAKEASGDLRQYFSGTGIQHFTGEALARFILPLPPLADLRRAVVKFKALSEKVENLESIYRRKLESLEALKKSLLHDAFRGAL